MKLLLKNFLLFAAFSTIIFVSMASLPLFDAYPKIQANLQHISLGAYPTPLIHAENLAKDLGIKDLYIKDDGANGYANGAIKYPGGSKNRKLEFLLADAKKQGFDTIVTSGAAGSNHACETAHCTQRLGMKSILLLNDQNPTSYTQRNLKLDVLFNADVRYISKEDNLDTQASLLAKNNNYYYIPGGGSNELGTLGYINAMFELRQQIKENKMPEPDVLYVTLATCGTAAGIIIGAKLADFKCRIIPVRISWYPEFKINLLLNKIKESEKFLNQIDPQINYQPLSQEITTSEQQTKYLQNEYNTFMEHDYTGNGKYEAIPYASMTKETAEAIDLMQKHTGIKLEGTFSGKTAAALINDARKKNQHSNNVVLFWNTFGYGAFEELTNSVPLDEVTAKLPIELRHYLSDKLQEFDKGI